MTKNQSIAILYFCTGTYDRYRAGFYESSEKYFFSDQNIEKHYYVWTDSKILLSQKLPNVTFIYQEALWRPNQTLYRFRIFLWQEDKLKNHDYIVFFNANFQFKNKVSIEEFLPSWEQNYMALLHFSYFDKQPNTFPYERSSNSQAYIPYDSGQYYYLWALNGWISDAYLKLCKQCDERIQQDEKNNIVPLRHDESILNKFLLNRTDIKNLDISYGYPEAGWFPKFPAKIISRSKEIFIWSKDKLRNSKKPKVSILKIIYIKGVYYCNRALYNLYSLYTK